jgi:hypothetical protein
MAKTYVHIVPSTSGVNADTKKALKGAVATKIKEAIVSEVTKGLPAKFSAKASDQPKTRGKVNAIRIDAKAQVKAVPEGTGLKVDVNILIEFSGIKMPKKTGGVMLGRATSGGGMQEPGPIEKAVKLVTIDVVKAAVSRDTRKTMSSPALKRKAAQVGLAI